MDFIYLGQFRDGQFDWLMSLFGLPFVIGTLLLLYLAFMTSFGRVELSLGQAGLLRLRKGGLGIYVTRTTPLAEVLSAELSAQAAAEDNGVSMRYACVLRLRAGGEWRFPTGENREQASWLAAFLTDQIGQRRERGV